MVTTTNLWRIELKQLGIEFYHCKITTGGKNAT